MKQLRLYFPNVGQGDSIYAEYEDGQFTWHMLVDCSKEPKNGIDLLKFLQGFVRPGADKKRHLDYLFVTHPHDDHIRGLGEIADEFVIDELWDSGHVPETNEGDAYKAYEKIKDECESRGVLFEKSTTYETVDICDGGIQALVLRPSNFMKDRAEMTDAELEEAIHTECMVLKLTFGSFSLMVTGDSNLESWKWIVEKSKYMDDDLKCTVLHGIHHGSKTAFWEKEDDTKKVAAYTTALEKLDPLGIVISVGKDNPYDLPNDDALEIYREAVGKENVFLTSDGTVVCTVAEDGAYSLRRDRSGIDVTYALSDDEDDDGGDGQKGAAISSIPLQSRTRLDDKPSARTVQ